MPTRSLLIAHQGALGDVVCLFPIIRMLRERYHPVTFLGQGHLGKLAAAERLVDDWLPIEAAWTASLFTDDPGSEAWRILAPYSRILVFSRSERLISGLERISPGRVCTVSPRPPADQSMHVAEHALAGILGCGLLAACDAAALRSAPSSGRSAAGGGSSIVLIHPGAGSTRKRWPLTGFLELAARITAGQRKPEFVIGPAELDLRRQLESRGMIIHLPGDCLGLLALLRSAEAFVGNDSGVSHLAAWTGLPTVAIFGPTDPARWRPLGPVVEIVRPPMECRPCFEVASENCAAEDCLDRITSEEVMQALQRVVPALTC
jgi:heptosyltransferase III